MNVFNYILERVHQFEDLNEIGAIKYSYYKAFEVYKEYALMVDDAPKSEVVQYLADTHFTSTRNIYRMIELMEFIIK